MVDNKEQVVVGEIKHVHAYLTTVKKCKARPDVRLHNRAALARPGGVDQHGQ